MTFSVFSYQWMGVVYVCLEFPFMLLDDLGPLLRVVSYGSITILISIVFIIVKALLIVPSEVKYFSHQYVTLASILTLAF
jgi:predicted membrane-bound spermidine synthase